MYSRCVSSSTSTQRPEPRGVRTQEEVQTSSHTHRSHLSSDTSHSSPSSDRSSRRERDRHQHPRLHLRFLLPPVHLRHPDLHLLQDPRLLLRPHRHLLQEMDHPLPRHLPLEEEEVVVVGEEEVMEVWLQRSLELNYVKLLRSVSQSYCCNHRSSRPIYSSLKCSVCAG